MALPDQEARPVFSQPVRQISLMLIVLGAYVASWACMSALGARGSQAPGTA